MDLAKKKIIDAKKPLILEITKKDVQMGATKDPTHCAAAVACKRQMGALSARVHVSRTYVEFDDHWIRYNTPISLRTEIVSFDRGHVFEPGEYKLNAVQPSHTSAALKKRDPAKRARIGAKRKTPKAGIKPHHIKGIRARAHLI